jgi:hypothetical protein
MVDSWGSCEEGSICSSSAISRPYTFCRGVDALQCTKIPSYKLIITNFTQHLESVLRAVGVRSTSGQLPRPLEKRMITRRNPFIRDVAICSHILEVVNALRIETFMFLMPSSANILCFVGCLEDLLLNSKLNPPLSHEGHSFPSQQA